MFQFPRSTSPRRSPRIRSPRVRNGRLQQLVVETLRLVDTIIADEANRSPSSPKQNNTLSENEDLQLRTLLHRSCELHKLTGYSQSSLGCIISELTDLTHTEESHTNDIQCARQNIDTWRSLGSAATPIYLLRAKKHFESYFSKFVKINGQETLVGSESDQEISQSPQIIHKGIDSILDRLEYCRVLFALNRKEYFAIASEMLEAMIGDWDAAISPLIPHSQQSQDLLAQVLFFSGVAFTLSGDVDRGNTRLAECAQLGPPRCFERTQILLLVGRNLERQFERQQGVVSLTGALTNDENANNFAADSWQGSQYSRSHSAESAAHEDSYAALHRQLLSEQKRLDAAGRESSDWVPEEMEDWLSSYHTWLWLADMLCVQGLYPLAIDLYSQALTRDPQAYQSAKIWLRLAKACHRSGKLRDGLLALQQATARLQRGQSSSDSAQQLYNLQDRWQRHLNNHVNTSFGHDPTNTSNFSPSSSISSVTSQKRRAGQSMATPLPAPENKVLSHSLEEFGLLKWDNVEDVSNPKESLIIIAKSLKQVILHIQESRKLSNDLAVMAPPFNLIQLQAVVRGMLCRAKLSIGPALSRVLDVDLLYRLLVEQASKQSDFPDLAAEDVPRQSIPISLQTSINVSNQNLSISIQSRTWSYSGAVTSVSVTIRQGDETGEILQRGRLLLPTVFAPPPISLRAQHKRSFAPRIFLLNLNLISDHNKNADNATESASPVANSTSPEEIILNRLRLTLREITADQLGALSKMQFKRDEISHDQIVQFLKEFEQKQQSDVQTNEQRRRNLYMKRSIVCHRDMRLRRLPTNAIILEELQLRPRMVQSARTHSTTSPQITGRIVSPQITSRSVASGKINSNDVLRQALRITNPKDPEDSNHYQVYEDAYSSPQDYQEINQFDYAVDAQLYNPNEENEIWASAYTYPYDYAEGQQDHHPHYDTEQNNNVHSEYYNTETNNANNLDFATEADYYYDSSQYYHQDFYDHYYQHQYQDQDSFIQSASYHGQEVSVADGASESVDVHGQAYYNAYEYDGIYYQQDHHGYWYYYDVNGNYHLVKQYESATSDGEQQQDTTMYDLDAHNDQVDVNYENQQLQQDQHPHEDAVDVPAETAPHTTLFHVGGSAYNLRSLAIFGLDDEENNSARDNHEVEDPQVVPGGRLLEDGSTVGGTDLDQESITLGSLGWTLQQPEDNVKQEQKHSSVDEADMPATHNAYITASNKGSVDLSAYSNEDSQIPASIGSEQQLNTPNASMVEFSIVNNNYDDNKETHERPKKSPLSKVQVRKPISLDVDANETLPTLATVPPNELMTENESPVVDSVSSTNANQQLTIDTHFDGDDNSRTPNAPLTGCTLDATDEEHFPIALSPMIPYNSMTSQSTQRNRPIDWSQPATPSVPLAMQSPSYFIPGSPTSFSQNLQMEVILRSEVSLAHEGIDGTVTEMSYLLSIRQIGPLTMARLVPMVLESNSSDFLLSLTIEVAVPREQFDPASDTTSVIMARLKQLLDALHAEKVLFPARDACPLDFELQSGEIAGHCYMLPKEQVASIYGKGKSNVWRIELVPIAAGLKGLLGSSLDLETLRKQQLHFDETVSSSSQPNAQFSMSESIDADSNQPHEDLSVQTRSQALPLSEQMDDDTFFNKELDVFEELSEFLPSHAPSVVQVEPGAQGPELDWAAGLMADHDEVESVAPQRESVLQALGLEEANRLKMEHFALTELEKQCSQVVFDATNAALQRLVLGMSAHSMAKSVVTSQIVKQVMHERLFAATMASHLATQIVQVAKLDVMDQRREQFVDSKSQVLLTQLLTPSGTPFSAENEMLPSESTLGEEMRLLLEQIAEEELFELRPTAQCPSGLVSEDSSVVGHLVDNLVQCERRNSSFASQRLRLLEQEESNEERRRLEAEKEAEETLQKALRLRVMRRLFADVCQTVVSSEAQRRWQEEERIRLQEEQERRDFEAATEEKRRRIASYMPTKIRSQVNLARSQHEVVEPFQLGSHTRGMHISKKQLRVRPGSGVDRRDPITFCVSLSAPSVYTPEASTLHSVSRPQSPAVGASSPNGKHGRMSVLQIRPQSSPEKQSHRTSLFSQTDPGTHQQSSIMMTNRLSAASVSSTRMSSTVKGPAGVSSFSLQLRHSMQVAELHRREVASEHRKHHMPRKSMRPIEEQKNDSVGLSQVLMPIKDKYAAVQPRVLRGEGFHRPPSASQPVLTIQQAHTPLPADPQALRAMLGHKTRPKTDDPSHHREDHVDDDDDDIPAYLLSSNSVHHGRSVASATAASTEEYLHLPPDHPAVQQQALEGEFKAMFDAAHRLERELQFGTVLEDDAFHEDEDSDEELLRLLGPVSETKRPHNDTNHTRSRPQTASGRMSAVPHPDDHRRQQRPHSSHQPASRKKPLPKHRQLPKSALAANVAAGDGLYGVDALCAQTLSLAKHLGYHSRYFSEHHQSMLQSTANTPSFSPKHATKKGVHAAKEHHQRQGQQDEKQEIWTHAERWQRTIIAFLSFHDALNKQLAMMSLSAAQLTASNMDDLEAEVEAEQQKLQSSLPDQQPPSVITSKTVSPTTVPSSGVSSSGVSSSAASVDSPSKLVSDRGISGPFSSEPSAVSSTTLHSHQTLGPKRATMTMVAMTNSVLGDATSVATHNACPNSSSSSVGLLAPSRSNFRLLLKSASSQSLVPSQHVSGHLSTAETAPPPPPPFLLLKKQLRILRKALHLPFLSQQVPRIHTRPRMAHFNDHEHDHDNDQPATTATDNINHHNNHNNMSTVEGRRPASPSKHPMESLTEQVTSLDRFSSVIEGPSSGKPVHETVQKTGLFVNTGVGHTLLGDMRYLSTEQLICALADCRGSLGEVLGKLRDPSEGVRYESDLQLACELVDIRSLAVDFPGAETLWEVPSFSSVSHLHLSQRSLHSDTPPVSSVSRWTSVKTLTQSPVTHQPQFTDASLVQEAFLTQRHERHALLKLLRRHQYDYPSTAESVSPPAQKAKRVSDKKTSSQMNSGLLEEDEEENEEVDEYAEDGFEDTSQVSQHAHHVHDTRDTKDDVSQSVDKCPTDEEEGDGDSDNDNDDDTFGETHATHPHHHRNTTHHSAATPRHEHSEIDKLLRREQRKTFRQLRLHQAQNEYVRLSLAALTHRPATHPPATHPTTAVTVQDTADDTHSVNTAVSTLPSVVSLPPRHTANAVSSSSLLSGVSEVPFSDAVVDNSTAIQTQRVHRNAIIANNNNGVATHSPGSVSLMQQNRRNTALRHSGAMRHSFIALTDSASMSRVASLQKLSFDSVSDPVLAATLSAATQESPHVSSAPRHTGVSSGVSHTRRSWFFPSHDELDETAFAPGDTCVETHTHPEQQDDTQQPCDTPTSWKHYELPKERFMSAPQSLLATQQAKRQLDETAELRRRRHNVSSAATGLMLLPSVSQTATRASSLSVVSRATVKPLATHFLSVASPSPSPKVHTRSASFMAAASPSVASPSSAVDQNTTSNTTSEVVPVIALATQDTAATHSPSPLLKSALRKSTTLRLSVTQDDDTHSDAGHTEDTPDAVKSAVSRVSHVSSSAVPSLRLSHTSSNTTSVSRHPVKRVSLMLETHDHPDDTVHPVSQDTAAVSVVKEELVADLKRVLPVSRHTPGQLKKHQSSVNVSSSSSLVKPVATLKTRAKSFSSSSSSGVSPDETHDDTPVSSTDIETSTATQHNTNKRMTRKDIDALVHHGSLLSPATVLCRRDALKAEQEETLLRSEKVHIRRSVEHQVLKRMQSKNALFGVSQHNLTNISEE